MLLCDRLEVFFVLGHLIDRIRFSLQAFFETWKFESSMRKFSILCKLLCFFKNAEEVSTKRLLKMYELAQSFVIKNIFWLNFTCSQIVCFSVYLVYLQKTSNQYCWWHFFYLFFSFVFVASMEGCVHPCWNYLWMQFLLLSQPVIVC